MLLLHYNQERIQALLGLLLLEDKIASLPGDPPPLRIDFESIVAVLPGHVYWKDRTLTFLGCNDKLASFFGLKSRYDIAGKTAHDFATSAEAKNIEAHDQAAIDAGHEITAEMDYTLPDGENAIFLVRK